ncbi:MAG: oligosaccharide flippase family protein [Anaerolineae bacterium]|nr:oligosaccharide flippase family protein [Gemmatimonadaceae bacterium]
MTLDAENTTLRRSTVVSGVFAVGTRSAQAVVSLLAAVVLARLLTPADFGIFAMVAPLALLANQIGNQSFQAAIIQAPDLSFGDVSALFWFAARVNAVVTGCMIASGFGLAQFYGEPRVVPVTIIWAAFILLLTLTGFQEALLKREMRFAAVLGVQFAALTIGIAVAVGTAWGGAGYWTFAFQVIATESVRLVWMHRLNPWQPARFSSPQAQSARELQSYWRSVMGFRVAFWLSEQPDRIVVGRLGGAAILGLYETARRWSWYAFTEPFFALSDVAVVSFSRALAEPDRFRRFVSRGILIMLSISLPIIAFAGAEAESIVLVLLGPRWEGAVPYVRILSVAAFGGAIGRVVQWVPLAVGEARRLLRWFIRVQLPVLLAAAAVGSMWGTPGVARAYAIALVTLALPAAVFCARGTALKLSEVMFAVARPALASLCGVAVLLVMQGALPRGAGVTHLAVALVVYVSVFAVAWLALPGGITASREIVVTFQEFRRAPMRADPKSDNM